MSKYTTEPNKFNSGPVASNGLDIDQAVLDTYSGDDGKTYLIKDYDILSRPTTSGTNVQIPAELDNGIPPRPQIIGQDADGSNVYGLQQMKLGSSEETMGERIDAVNNGRVGNIDIISNKFTGKEADIVIKKDNQETSIKGIVETTALSDLFFSDMNQEGIQKSIRYKVYEATDQIISEQSKNSLYIIMRSILLQYGNFRVSTAEIIEEIRYLNQQVIDYCVENVSSNVQQYLGYIKDLEKLPVPMDRPVYHNKQNFTYDISNLL